LGGGVVGDDEQGREWLVMGKGLLDIG